MTEHDLAGFDPTRPGGWAYRPDLPITGPLDYTAGLPITGVGGEAPSLHFVFTDDGAYLPAVVRAPEGPGMFPAMICVHGGSGGLGIGWMVDSFVNRGSLFDRLIEEGYAVVWTEGRREIPKAYGSGIDAVLDHEDIINTLRYVQRLPFVDAERVGFFGVSHGGELQMKLICEIGSGPAALIPAEPAVHEFLGLRHVGPFDEEHLQYREVLRDDQIDVQRAMARIECISPDVPILLMGRDDDHFQGLFKKLFELLERAGKRAQWISSPHREHAFHWGPLRSRRVLAYQGAVVETETEYQLDDLQRVAHDQIVDFLTEHIPSGR